MVGDIKNFIEDDDDCVAGIAGVVRGTARDAIFYFLPHYKFDDYFTGKI
jgi:hypothetical protein